MLDDLLRDLVAAPAIYRPGPYWDRYQEMLVREVRGIDWRRSRSGQYPIFRTFGFGDTVYFAHPFERQPKRTARRLLVSLFDHLFADRQLPLLPYGIKLKNLREMAYALAEVHGQRCGAPPISSIEASDFGSPADLWTEGGRRYTMAFLNSYVRYCTLHSVAPIDPNGVVVELGSGSGDQVIVLKKLYPSLTVLCFDLPVPLYCAEHYLKGALGPEQVVSAAETRTWDDLSRISPGKVHLFGNWRFPLLLDFSFDLFWNAASFGEMELPIVENYVHLARGATTIYLMQAVHGKADEHEQTVREVIRQDDYERMLADYRCLLLQEAPTPLGRMNEAGGYFSGAWQRR